MIRKMKHLQSFNESLESNEWYQKIDREEYINIGFDAIEDFTSKEIEIIKSHLNDIWPNSDIDLLSDMEDKVSRITFTYRKNSHIIIHKLIDDFFLFKKVTYVGNASFKSVFYKADELEGLIKLLKNYSSSP